MSGSLEPKYAVMPWVTAAAYRDRPSTLASTAASAVFFMLASSIKIEG